MYTEVENLFSCVLFVLVALGFYLLIYLHPKCIPLGPHLIESLSHDAPVEEDTQEGPTLSEAFGC